MSKHNFNFGDVWTYVLSNGVKGTEVAIIAEIADRGLPQIKRVYYYLPRTNQISKRITKYFLEDFIFIRKAQNECL